MQLLILDVAQHCLDVLLYLQSDEVSPSDLGSSVLTGHFEILQLAILEGQMDLFLCNCNKRNKGMFPNFTYLYQCIVTMLLII